MHMRQSIIVVVAFVAVSVTCTPVALAGSGDAATQMSTNIAVLSSADHFKRALDREGQQQTTVVDPSALLQGAVSETNDIVEDPNDPFITSKSGKPRPNFVSTSAEEWAETPISKQQQQPLHRVKRCGDDDGDANRARRARRARRNRARRARRAQRRAERRAAKQAAASTTTTTVRKVIQDGQVVSETVVPHQGAVVQQQPQVVQAPAPQAVVVQHQPAPQQVVAAAPQPQVVAAPQAQPQAQQQQQQQQPAATPSISVQGSVKVN